jgi:hypothetical protein
MNKRSFALIRKQDMALLVCDALESRGGKGTIVEVATFIWENYKDELEASGEIFYTWQYDMRWARHRLSEKGKLITKSRGRESVWVLVN